MSKLTRRKFLARGSLGAAAAGGLAGGLAAGVVGVPLSGLTGRSREAFATTLRDR